MLWRKTKLFEDEERMTSAVTKNRSERNKAAHFAFDKKHSVSFTAHRPTFKTSTPSYIEFYYLDDNDERLKRREVIMPMANLMKKRLKADINNKNGNQKPEWDPVLSFYVNEPEFKFVTPPLHRNIAHFHEKPQLRSKTFYDKQSMYDFIREKLKAKNVVLAKMKSALSSNKKTTDSKKSHDEETCPVTFTYGNMNSTNNDTTLTSVYDKIKFFETYDQHTQPPDDKQDRYRDMQNMIKENYIDSNQKVVLEDINKNIGHQHTGLHQTHVKKHVSDDFENKIKNNNNTVNTTTTNHVTCKINNTSNEQNPTRNYNFFMTDQKLFNYTLKAAKNASKPVLWSDYPFAAVYIYEPSQIHCDAAALSPHWLMASGACLSRYHRKDPMTERRSAFVAYCGEDWWSPERITYVKYIVVHPRYHPKDDKRKYLYNIGLIQVVGSMASACVSWEPISIMSHHFAANAEGTLVTAVGWGMDRYDVRYFQSHVPKVPLHIYKANVYSSSCPGNKAYR
ncbi:unnamed protein product [Diatraea saccharalis]|uniref:Peptidase S1 domain-containing protein n=1 Tax=Diatraea saccharalis TaxID=40085 RepID=A0A9N9W9N8_9NEOP|nr:unnamed protein product [Diatraea saccharalis]